MLKGKNLPMPQAIARGYATRVANMQRRRERILDDARALIAEQGFDGLNLRDLAERAAVTVPTIYNLIGDKGTLIQSLFEDAISPFEHLTYIPDPTDPLSGIESFLDTIVATFRKNENYYRAELLTHERLEQAGDPSALDQRARGEQVAIAIYTEAQEVGLIRGQISARQLGAQFFRSFRFTRHEWASGHIDLTTLRSQSLQEMYLVLVADATPKFYPQLIEKIRLLGRSRRTVKQIRKKARAPRKGTTK